LPSPDQGRAVLTAAVAIAMPGTDPNLIESPPEFWTDGHQLVAAREAVTGKGNSGGRRPSHDWPEARSTVDRRRSKLMANDEGAKLTVTFMEEDVKQRAWEEDDEY
ncbi:uncharacterized protein J3R85_008100, partial [Psidium guajava]